MIFLANRRRQFTTQHHTIQREVLKVANNCSVLGIECSYVAVKFKPSMLSFLYVFH